MLIKNELSIKDLEALSGIKAHTIRVWEQRYGIIVPNRTSTNIRTYSNDDLKTLLNISLLNKKGYKISKIAQMSAGERRRKVEELHEQDSSYEAHVDALTMAMIELDEARFEKVISRGTIQYGFEKMMECIIYPFLEKIGVMWMTSTIHPAQEHFMANLIRQKLLVAIDGHPVNPDKDADRYVLFLPEGEIHELSLLYLSYLLRQHEKHVIYLGLSVPLEDLVAVCTLFKPVRIVTMATVHPTGENLANYLRDVAKQLPGVDIYVGGACVHDLNGNLPDRVTKLGTLSEFRSMIG